MRLRRALLLSSLVSFVAAPRAQQSRSLRDPLRLGVDPALHASGLAPALQRGFGRDTGVAVKLVPMPALLALQALERGELDAALCNAPLAEAALVAQGFAHERRAVAVSEFVIVGPVLRPAAVKAAPVKSASANKNAKQPKPSAAAKARDPAGLMGTGNAAQALQRLGEASVGDDTIRFLSAHDGSGTHAAEQALWRAAKLAPEAAWYRQAKAPSQLLAQARRERTYALVERGVWADLGGAPLEVLIQGDPILRVPVHVMQGFRSKHGAAKLFTAWVTGPKGRSVVAAQRGYRLP
jgi:tungstate transport system substrate-binding protein